MERGSNSSPEKGAGFPCPRKPPIRIPMKTVIPTIMSIPNARVATFFDIGMAEALSLWQDYFLSLRGRESSALIRPGSFFFDLDTEQNPRVFPRGDFTLFRLFAPRATRVTLVVLDHPDSWGTAVYHSLLRQSDGMWEAVPGENVTGKYYWYRVDGSSQGPYSRFDPDVNILDPYALATVGRHGPGIVVDRKRQGRPRAFQAPKPEDLVIGEVHLRDLLAKAPVPLSESERKGYAGLTAWLRSPPMLPSELGGECGRIAAHSRKRCLQPRRVSLGLHAGKLFCPGERLRPGSAPCQPNRGVQGSGGSFS